MMAVIIHLGRQLLVASSNLPESWLHGGPPRGMPRHADSLFGLAPGGVYLARRVAPPAGELLPHRFTLTARQPKLYCGGLLSAALSLALRPVDVIDHPVLRSPDFPPVAHTAA